MMSMIQKLVKQKLNPVSQTIQYLPINIFTTNTTIKSHVTSSSFMNNSHHMSIITPLNHNNPLKYLHYEK